MVSAVLLQSHIAFLQNSSYLCIKTLIMQQFVFTEDTDIKAIAGSLFMIGQYLKFARDHFQKMKEQGDELGMAETMAVVLLLEEIMETAEEIGDTLS